MNSNNNTTRLLKPKECLDGTQEWTSMTHAANIGGEIHVKPHLPGIIIFVHGVNSEGEWYDDAEEEICNGLNERLNLTDTPYELKANEYYKPNFIVDLTDLDNSHYIYEEPIRTLKKLGNSPIIRFYWGYRATDEELGQYAIPLKNKVGESYHRLVDEIVSSELSNDSSEYHSLPDHKKIKFINEKIKHKGPFFWGGGPFQNGCNNLISLWSETGFSNWPMLWTVIPIPAPFPLPINAQAINPESNRLLTKSPPRDYYAHAVKRLAELIKKIREYNKNDTVTLISHSQGTMIALGAAAIEAPDALFVLNSPYAIDDKVINTFTYPYDENINKEIREATLKEIIDKVAKNKDRLKNSPGGYAGLVVGRNDNKKSWSPNGIMRKGFKLNIDTPKLLEENELRFTEENTIKERDNHGNTYIYCNPHDRVMGSSPLQSIGWSGIPNITEQGQIKPHPLFNQQVPLYIRMLARNTPCGNKPDPQTMFSDENSRFRDGNIFWDSNTKTLDGLAWPKPPKNISLNINAPEVPYPLTENELALFDEDFAIAIPESDTKENEEENPQNIKLGEGYGNLKYDAKKHEYVPVDAEYYFYKDLYSYQHRIWVDLTPEEKKQLKNNPLLDQQEQNATTRYETLEEMKARIRDYIPRPTDHGSLPRNTLFLRRVLTYDLPIGYCEIGKNPEKMSELRNFADWLNGVDNYIRTGELDIPPMPTEISNPDLTKVK